jgi:hypothetical protein
MFVFHYVFGILKLKKVFFRLYALRIIPGQATHPGNQTSALFIASSAFTFAPVQT